MTDNPIPKASSKAEQLLAIEMFSNLLVSVKPADIGKKLTEQIRELTGAQTVVLFSHAENTHYVLAACPERRHDIFSESDLDVLCLDHHPEDIPFDLALLDNEHPIKKICSTIGITSLIRIPLAAFDELVATLAVCNLHNIERLYETYELLISLAPVVALALRNALSAEKIEQQTIALKKQADDLEIRVRERTAELEKANQSLELSRIAALNMMQDAIDAQKSTEAAVASLDVSKALYEDVVNNLEVGIYRLRWVYSNKEKPYAYYEFFNDRYCELTGFSREALEQDSSLVTQTIHPDDKASFADENTRSGANNALFSWEGRMLLYDGYRFVHIEAVPRKLENDDIVWTGTFNDITERKMAEEILKKERERLSGILKGTNAGTWEWNIQTGETIFNERWADIIGYSLEELAPITIITWINAVHPDDLKISRELLEKHFKGELDYYECEARMKHKNGSWIWVLDRGKVISWTDDGKPLVMMGTHQDINNRKMTEEALRVSNTLNMAILENSPIGISVRSTTGQLLSYNTAWKDIWNISDSTIEEDKKRKRKELRFDQRDAYFKPYQADVRKVYEEGGSYYIPEMKTSKMKNGYPLWISQHFYAITDTLGAVERVVILTEDITERKHNEEVLKESEEKFRSYIEASPIAMFLVNDEGRFTKVNRAACDMVGYTYEELYTKHIPGLLPPEKQEDISTFVELKEKGHMAAESVLLHKNGNRIPIQISGVKLSDTEYMAFCADISAIKQAEEALRKSEERHRVLYETMTQGVVFHNLKGEIEFANNAALSILGLTRDEIEGRTSMDPRWKTIHEDGSTFPGNDHPAMQVLATGSPVNNVVIGVYHPQDDRYAWVLVSAVPYIDPHTKQLAGSYAVFADITENKNAEDTIAQSEKKYRMLFKEMMNGFALHEIICDSQGNPVDYRFLEVNPAFELLTGLSSKDLTGKTVKEIMPATEDIWIQRYGRVALSGEPDMFMNFSEALNKYFEVLAYCPEHGKFAVIFNDVTERTKAEILIRESEARLTRAEYVSDSGNWEYDMVKKVGRGSVGAKRVYGIDTELWTTEQIRAIQLPQYRDPLDKVFREFIENGKPYDVEFQIRHPKTGEIRDIHSIAEYDEKKQIVFGVVQDITARKKAEEEIKLYFDMSIDLLCIANFDGYFTRINPAWVKLMGWSEEEMYARPFLDFVHEDDKQSTMMAVESLIKGERVVGFDNRYRTKEGSYRWISWNAFALLDRKIIMAVARDITEKKLSEEILRSNEERLRSALESANDSFYDWNLISKTGYYNPRLYDILGYSPDEFSPNYGNFIEYIHPDDRAHVAEYDDWYLKNPQGQYDVEFRMKCKNGEYKWIRSRGKVVEFTDDGQPRRLTGIHSDVTTRKKHEEDLRILNEDLERRVAQRTAELSAYNRELEAFSYSVSHDLRSPLRSINGFSQVLYEDYADTIDDSGRDYLRRIMQATQRMGVLIDDLLNLSRITRYEMQHSELDLAHMAHMIIEELQSGDRGRSVHVHISSPLKVVGDEHLLQIVLQNLLGNAWKFTAKTTEPEIEFTSEERPEGHVFIIRDNGAGFDMQYVDKLFGVFQRLHSTSEFPGTGVGLAIVQRIITRHGGKVWAESEIGKGATFYFTVGDVGICEE